MPKIPPHVVAILHTLADANIHPQIEENRRFKLRWTAPNGAQVLLVVGRHPPDPRSYANALALARRLARSTPSTSEAAHA
jgi:hypothetical protein